MPSNSSSNQIYINNAVVKHYVDLLQLLKLHECDFNKNLLKK